MASNQRGVFRTAITTDLLVGVEQDMLGTAFDTVYPWPAGPIEWELDSNNNTDTGEPPPGGTGVQQVELNMVDATYNSTTILMDTPVSAAVPSQVPGGPWLRCNGMRITRGGVNAQTGGATDALNLQPLGGGVLLAQIRQGGSRWQSCIYTIPSDETIELIGMDIELVDAANLDEVIGTMVSRRPGENVWNNEVSTSIVTAERSSSAVRLRFLTFDAGTDLLVRCTASVVQGGGPGVLGRLALKRTQRVGVL